MTMRIEYTKGMNNGFIADNSKGDNKEFVATICTGSSKWFKTFKGAEKWMNNNGYARAN